MSQFDDIGNLFRRFGGNPADYHEVANDDEMSLAQKRWPLLQALAAHAQADVPAVGQPSVSAPTRQGPIRINANAPHDRPVRSRGLPRLFARDRQAAPAAPRTPAVQAAAARFSAQSDSLHDTGLQTPAPKNVDIATLTAHVSRRVAAPMPAMSVISSAAPSTAVPQRASNTVLQELFVREPAPADKPPVLGALFRRLESAEPTSSSPQQHSEAGARP